MTFDIDAVKSRLGSVSNTKLESLPEGIKRLLAQDLPYIIRELKAARGVIQVVQRNYFDVPALEAAIAKYESTVDPEAYANLRGGIG